MFKYINQCDVYVGLWCIYMLQGVLYPQGIINQLLQLAMLLWSMIALFKYIILPSIYSYSSILKATFILIIMYLIYGSIHIMFGETMFYGRYVYLQNSLNSLVPIFLFYDFAMNGKLTSDRIRVYLPILIVTCILLYYKNESLMQLKMNKEEITNNAGYNFVPLIPFLFFYKRKPVLQYVLIGIILLFIFMGMKRGAILIGVLSTIVLLYANLKNSTRWMKFIFAMLSIVIIVGVSKYIDYMMNSNEYFMARFEQTMEGDSSGRDSLYGNLLDTLLLESRPLFFFLGRGAESTVKIAGNFAHQDWLETFCNNGLVGIYILIFFFYTLANNVWKSKEYFPRMIFYSFTTLFLVIFIKTLFSMSIQDLNVSESMLIGYFAFELDNLEYSSNDGTYN